MTDPTFSPNAAPQPTTKRRVDLDGPDFYPTPEWATRALLEVEPFEGRVWEPACGAGAISKVLEERGFTPFSTDLYNRGYGESGLDFTMMDTYPGNWDFDNIITNPPYNSAESFVRVGFLKARMKLALLLRLAFLEGQGRYERIFSRIPPSRVWVFSNRVTFYPAEAEVKGSGTTAYAWFIWEKPLSGTTELKWIPPGIGSLTTNLTLNSLGL